MDRRREIDVAADRRVMLAYVIRRLVYAIITFIGITVATFALIHSVPGDPVLFYAGRHAGSNTSAAIIDAIRHEYHLDKPLPKQYAYWLRGIVTLDFGRSLVDRRSVTEVIEDKLREVCC